MANDIVDLLRFHLRNEPFTTRRSTAYFYCCHPSLRSTSTSTSQQPLTSGANSPLQAPQHKIYPLPISPDPSSPTSLPCFPNITINSRIPTPHHQKIELFHPEGKGSVFSENRLQGRSDSGTAQNRCRRWRRLRRVPQVELARRTGIVIDCVIATCTPHPNDLPSSS